MEVKVMLTYIRYCLQISVIAGKLIFHRAIVGAVVFRGNRKFDEFEHSP
jgi:hypothetical protein